MPPDRTRKPANKKGSAGTGTKNLIDDAPLFAGLDGFVLSHPQKTEPESQPSDKPMVKEVSTASQKVHSKAADPQPDRVTKIPKASPPASAALLLTVTEMCGLLNISRATLVRMDNAGKLPGRIKLGGSVRFHRATVETWLQSLISNHPSP